MVSPWLWLLISTHIECEGAVDSLGISRYNVGEVSEYARRMLLISRYDEVEAEYMTLQKMKGGK